MRSRFTWRIGKRALELGARTPVMGVVNVTPDSFSDGGLHFDPADAVAHALRLLDEGADILDIGGESTRPGSATERSLFGSAGQRPGTGDQRPVTAEEELCRVLPVIVELKRRRPRAVISVDTYKASVARAAVEAGAEIVNDVSGFRWDTEMPATVAALGCGVVLMHTRGRPHEWRNLPPLAADDMLALVQRELAASAQAALGAGVAREAIVLDPGFGFGKNYEENHALLAHFADFHQLGFPLLAGASRKSFLGRLMARGGPSPPPGQRLPGSLAAAVICAMQGAHILRVHDVRETVAALSVVDAII
jgi:dihydropteroate synthase